MNKETFLKNLEKKLKILEEQERKDIIDEYRQTIEEKVAHGQTEEEAVSDFGNMNDLVKEILKAYKVNPDYDADDVVKKGENFIKNSAKQLASFTENIIEDLEVNSKNFTLEKVFEIIIKVFILLIALAILRLPFHIFGSILGNILSFGVEPFSHLITGICSIIINLLYVAVCIFIIVIAFKRYINPAMGNKETNQAEGKKENISEKPKKKVVAENKSSDYVRESHNYEHNDNPLITVLKVLAVIFFLIPLGFAIFGLMTATIVLFLLTIKGLPLLGATIIVLGITFFVNGMFELIRSPLFRRRLSGLGLFITSAILIPIGAFIAINDFYDVEYYDYLPTNEIFELESKEYTEYIDNILYYNGKPQIQIDNSLSDGELKISVKYYKEFSSVNYEFTTGSNKYYLDISSNHRNIKGKDIRKVVDLVFENVKDKKLYNYDILDDSKVVITVNDDTLKYLRAK